LQCASGRNLTQANQGGHQLEGYLSSESNAIASLAINDGQVEVRQGKVVRVVVVTIGAFFPTGQVCLRIARPLFVRSQPFYRP
jgi:hypothetical protein